MTGREQDKTVAQKPTNQGCTSIDQVALVKVKPSQLAVQPRTLWYILWSAMLLISAVNTLASYPIFSGGLGVVFSMILVTIACIQMLRNSNLLCRKEMALAVVLLMVFGTAQLIHWVYTLGLPPTYRGFDFSAYYLAAKVSMETPGQSLYQLPLYADGRMNLFAPAPASSAWPAAALRYHVPFSAPFIYPPFFVVLMKPLAHLTFASAFTAWKIISTLLLVGATLFSLSIGGMRTTPRLALMLGVGLFCYHPFRDSLFLGQIDCLILFLYTAGVWLFVRKQTALSALSFAAATLIKLTPVLAVPVLIFHRRWKWLAAYVFWMVALLCLSVWQVGWAAHQEFWHRVLPSISSGAPVYQNSSIVAYIQELFLGNAPDFTEAPLSIPAHAGFVSRLVGFAVYLLMLLRFYSRRRDGDVTRDLVITALLGLAVSPISWWHHYTIALLPFIYLWCTMKEKDDRTLMLLFLAVATNILGFSQLVIENHAARMILAAVVPSLTIVLAYRSLTQRQRQFTNSLVPEADAVTTTSL